MAIDPNSFLLQGYSGPDRCRKRPRDAQVTDVFKKVKKSKIDSPNKTLGREILQYVWKEENRSDDLLLHFAKMIFPVDGSLSMGAINTVRQLLTSDLKGLLAKDLEDRVLFVTEHLIQDLSVLEHVMNPFITHPSASALIPTRHERTFIDVRREFMCYLFHGHSIEHHALQRLIEVLQTGCFSFEGTPIPIGPIWDICRKGVSGHGLSALSNAINCFIHVNQSNARAPWSTLSNRLFLIEDDQGPPQIVNFQVLFEGYSLPFTGNLADFQPFENMLRLYFLSDSTLIPVCTFSALSTHLNNPSVAQKAAQIVACHNQTLMDASWYLKSDALILANNSLA